MREDEEDWREYYVTPRYLAGSSFAGDPVFADVPDTWPHYEPDDYGGRFVITSPDRRIHIGWDGDGLDELWRIGAYEQPVGRLRWLVTANHATPPEIIAGLTRALVNDYETGRDAFLDPPSPYWPHAAVPLLGAGWSRGAARNGTVEILAPDHMAGLLINQRALDPDDEVYTLWAGPPGYTRAQITFTARTPSHLVAATAAAFSDPRPVVRERRLMHPDVAHAVHLEPVSPAPARPSTVPTPLDARRAAVSAALQRAQHLPGNGQDIRTAVARTRNTGIRPSPTAIPQDVPTPPRHTQPGHPHR
ncbi:DUF317 domain-containing protein [Streptomyces jietaisiensis]|uniref:DUF317 domain-containing protein n=1 Tax=Streptomyces griseoaurantiacus TaxID=68213 RepID=UPI003250F8DB